ncbi:Rieske (2Fe-2S) protein [Pseudomonas sp. FP597]|uniref:Rieske (2Fe-2S) protein n=1 Tax=Pseudomonas sp. FP597 TaxID=2954096 RepID=UPI00351E15E2
MDARRTAAEEGLSPVVQQLSLVRVAEIGEGQSLGLDPRSCGSDELFALRHQGCVYLYRNSCPHQDIPMQYRKDRFLSADGKRVICYAHGAHFEPDTGLCTHGPCLGERLRAVPWIDVDGWVVIDGSLLDGHY